jgi:uncharacterized protein (UPF0332 family)
MNAHWTKAVAIAHDAHLLAAAGRTLSVANRTYYAMFHGARALLEHFKEETSSIKTHAGLIRRFGAVAVQKHGFPRDVALLFRRHEGERLVADYTEDTAALSAPSVLIRNMDEFLSQIALFAGETYSIGRTP